MIVIEATRMLTTSFVQAQVHLKDVRLLDNKNNHALHHKICFENQSPVASLPFGIYIIRVFV